MKIFAERPEFAFELAAPRLGLEPLAAESVEALSGDLMQLSAPQARADAVVLVKRDGKPVLALVVEVQLSRDRHKPFSWPVYVAGVRARFECPTALVVVTPYPGVANWARREILLGPRGDRLRPLVLGPEAIPAITDPEVAAANQGLALLSSLARPRGPEAVPVALAALLGADKLVGPEFRMYNDQVALSLGARERAELEALMQSRYEVKTEFLRRWMKEGLEQGLEQGLKQGLKQGREQGREQGRTEGEAKGEAKGKSDALLAVLAARKLAISSAQRERILACHDLAELDRWIVRAAVAKKTAEIFAPEA